MIGPLLNAQAEAQNLPVVVTYLTFTIPFSPTTSGVSMVTLLITCTKEERYPVSWFLWAEGVRDAENHQRLSAQYSDSFCHSRECTNGLTYSKMADRLSLTKNKYRREHQTSLHVNSWQQEGNHWWLDKLVADQSCFYLWNHPPWTSLQWSHIFTLMKHGSSTPGEQALEHGHLVSPVTMKFKSQPAVRGKLCWCCFGISRYQSLNIIRKGMWW